MITILKAASLWTFLAITLQPATFVLDIDTTNYPSEVQP